MFPEIWSVTDGLFCHFGPFFALLPSLFPSSLLTNWKIWILKKWKKHLEISPFYTKVPSNHDHMLYCSWDMVCDRYTFYFWFWSFLSLYTPNSPKNKNLKKMKKTHGYIIILHMYITNYDDMMFSSWDKVCNRRMNGWTDRWKKWHIEVELAKI